MKSKWVIRKGKRINEDYEKYIRGEACLVCRQVPVDLHHLHHNRSDSYMGTPLCRSHHTANANSYHALGHDSFEQAHGLDFESIVFELLTEYLESKK